MKDATSRSSGKRPNRRSTDVPGSDGADTWADSALLAELSQRALTQSNLRIVMEDACLLVEQRLKTEFVKILQLVPSGEGFLLVSGIGWMPGYVGQVVVPLIDESQAGYTMRHGESIVVEDLRTEKRFRGMPLLHEHGIVSGISVIVEAERKHGIMTAHTKTRRKFTPKEVEFLERVADVVGSAMEHWETEQALRESDERLRLAMDAGGMGTWEWNPHTGEVIWSETLERIHGLEPGEFGKTYVDFFKFVHPEDREDLQLTISRALSTGYHEIEYRAVLGDGSLRWLEIRGLLVRDEHEQPMRMIGVCMDITDRKMSEQAILLAEEQYRAIFENAAFGVFQTTPGGRFLRANQALARILGFSSAEEMIAEVEDIGMQVHVDPERRAEFARLLTENEDVSGFVSQARRRDGTLIWISLTGRARRNSSGTAISFEGIVEDITERKLAETLDAAQYGVTRALAEAGTVEEALPGVLEALCSELGWALGQIFIVGADKKRMVCREQCECKPLKGSVAEYSRNLSFERGIGLPGRVWESGQPAWIEDVGSDDNFPRLKQAKEDGLMSGVAFPVVLGREVIGVMEFFSTDFRRRDDDTLQAMASIGSQVGQFIQRKRAEEELASLVIELEAAQERVHTLVSNVPGVVWEAWGEPDKRNQRIDFVSRYVEEMLGYSVDEWLSTPNFWLNIVHPDDREMAANRAREQFEGAGGLNAFRWVTKDGRTLWVESQSTVIRDKDGNPLGLRGVTMDISERREADAKIRETEERFSKAFHASPAGLSIVSVFDRRFVDVNESFLEIIGRSRDEVVGKLVDEVGVWFLPGDRDRMAEALNQGEGHARNIEVQLRSSNGDVRQVLGSAEVITLGGEPCVLSLMYDITERKQAEAALREESETLEALHRVGQMLSAQLDLRTLVQAVTDAATVRTGARFGAFFFNETNEAGESYRLYTLSGMDPAKFEEFPMPRNTGIFGPTFRGEGIIRLDDVTQDERYGKNPPFHGMPEGHPEVRSYMAMPVVSRGGKVLGGLFLGHPRAGVFREREERIAAGLASQAAIAMDNAQLYEAERVARAEAEAAVRRQAFLAEASAILSSSLDYEETLASLARLCVPFLADWCSIDLIDGDTIRRMTVVHSDPAKLEVALRLQQEYPPDPTSANVQQLLKGGKPVFYPEIPLELVKQVARTEEHYEIFLSLGLRSSMAVPLLAGGRTVGILTLVTAESGRVFTEADVALAEDLGQRAGLAVDNAMLFRASQEISAELRRANEAKDEFLGLVSHELRTPITTIYGGARLLRTRSGKIDEESRNSVLEDIEHESERLHRIVEDLLVLARVELGEEVQTEPILIQRMVEKTVSAFNKRRPGRAFIVDVEDGMEPVRGSNVYLEQILRNLMNNADKYSPPDTAIEVHTHTVDGEAVVSVMDRGPGIPAEESELIFERFYRSTGTAKSAGGAGIGLTVCRRLVEAQNGRIWAQPREGGGLVVSFSLPRYEDLS